MLYLEFGGVTNVSGWCVYVLLLILILREVPVGLCGDAGLLRYSLFL